MKIMVPTTIDPSKDITKEFSNPITGEALSDYKVYLDLGRGRREGETDYVIRNIHNGVEVFCYEKEEVPQILAFVYGR